MSGEAQKTQSPKLFGEWGFDEVKVRDMGLQRYLSLNPTYLPHSGGKHEARRFKKSEMNIVERLINGLMRPGSSGGEKARTTNIVKNAFKIINLKTGRNPIEVLVRAIENAAPNEDTTRISYGGVVYRLAVDISPQRRIDLALRYIIQGAKATAFSNRKTLDEVLAEQIIGAANGDPNNFAIKRRLELERVALSSR
ncbi:MAG: 30S ribosomal protein S7 [Candidatus Bathyarchaeia archaeon]